MQITVTFRGKNISLPIATGETIQGLIYRGISTDPDFSGQIHNYGKKAGKRCFKLFTFSELRGRYEIKCDRIVYASEAALDIRSADAYFIQLLFTYFTCNRSLRLGDNDVEVSDLTLTDFGVYSDTLRIRTLSPITVYVTKSDGHTSYFSPLQEEFYALIRANTKRKWTSCNDSDITRSFSVEPVEGSRFIKRATRFKDTYITAWHGSFILRGEPRVLNFLYNTGLGSKNSQGFGMFEII